MDLIMSLGIKTLKDNSFIIKQCFIEFVLQIL